MELTSIFFLFVCLESLASIPFQNGIFCFENRMQSIKNEITLTFVIFAFPSKVLRHRRTKPCSILAYLFYLKKNHLSNENNVIESGRRRRGKEGGNMTTTFCTLMKIIEIIVKTYHHADCWALHYNLNASFRSQLSSIQFSCRNWKLWKPNDERRKSRKLTACKNRDCNIIAKKPH